MPRTSRSSPSFTWLSHSTPSGATRVLTDPVSSSSSRSNIDIWPAARFFCARWAASTMLEGLSLETSQDSCLRV